MFWLLLSPAAGAAAWLTDFAAAQAQAKAENKLVLINFTGSDWCGWCIRLKKEVFAKPEFDAYAAENLVLLEIDFPRKKPLSAAQRKANQKLAEQYNVEGYPTIIVLSPEGKVAGKLGYRPGGTRAFLGELQKLPGAKPAPAAAKTPPKKSEPPPLFNGAATQPPPEYAELALKGISGPPNRRLALINNETLGAGETGKVRLGKTEVKVRCEEIREDSVIVTIDGATERRELFLRGGL
jgi:protein disulfide-isomerase